jgi:hypothetical protein
VFGGFSVRVRCSVFGTCERLFGYLVITRYPNNCSEALSACSVYLNICFCSVNIVRCQPWYIDTGRKEVKYLRKLSEKEKEPDVTVNKKEFQDLSDKVKLPRGLTRLIPNSVLRTRTSVQIS